jgi:MFS family permease
MTSMTSMTSMPSQRYRVIGDEANTVDDGGSPTADFAVHVQVQAQVQVRQEPTGLYLLQVQAPHQPLDPLIKKRRRAVVLFSLCTVLLFADQNLMSPNLTAIANDFGLNPEERDRQLGGDISLAFFLLGAPASFLVGCLADQADRSALFAWTVGIGESACLATYFVKTYRQLYICRAVTGFSVGGALPLIYSILGDLFAAQDRHVVSAVVSFGMGAGISVGQAIAGFLGPTFGWRLPFLVVAVPALLVALAVFIFVEDPERGAMEQVVLEQHQHPQEDDDAQQLQQREGGDWVPLVPITGKSARALSSSSSSSERSSASASSFPNDKPQQVPQTPAPTLQREEQLIDSYFDDMCSEHYGSFYSQRCSVHVRTMLKLLSTPTVLLAVVQGAPGCIPWGVLNVFLNDYLSEDRGFSVEMATMVLMCFSFGNVFGLILGGIGGRHLYQYDNRFPALLAGSMAIMGCFPLWILLNAVDSTTPYWLVALIAFTGGFGSGPTGPIIKATMTNVTLPRARGQAFALFNLFDDLGKGLGPYFVSILITQMGGRLPAFNVGVFGWIICGVANLAIFFTVKQDEATVQTTLAAQLQMTQRPSPSSLVPHAD